MGKGLGYLIGPLTVTFAGPALGYSGIFYLFTGIEFCIVIFSAIVIPSRLNSSENDGN